MRRHLGRGLCIATLLVATACGGDDDAADNSSNGTTELDGSGVSVPDSDVIDSTDTADTGAGSTTVPGATGTTVKGSGTTVAGSGTTVAGSGTTVAGAGTTVAGSGTTAAPPSTNAIPEEPADLLLVADGIGALRFGAPSDSVIAAINVVLGAPGSDTAAEYEAVGDGTFQAFDTEDPPQPELGFGYPFGRTVCWPNGLCAEFGGTAAGNATFVGWYYAATDTAQLATADGITVGARWADHIDQMTVEPGGCFSVGYGSSSGVSLTLQSSGIAFSVVDDAGNATPALPDPADVTVMQMQAGEQVIFLASDC